MSEMRFLGNLQERRYLGVGDQWNVMESSTLRS